jgi:chemotaxis protein methyltransferase CheR
MTLEPIKRLVREHCGLSFADGREALLAEGVRTRLAKRGLSTTEAYCELLAGDPDEIGRLVNLITVNETYFFREPAHFKILTEQLVPELWSFRGGHGRLKIVCAGCSTGEEPYTIAMALHERFGPGFASRFSIVGFDIDDEALGAACQGVYAEHSFRGVPRRIRDAFFEREGDRHRLAKACREAVNFIPLNICDDAYPEALADADVVFYRNVSLYFEPETQQRIFRRLAGLLHERGYLFLGATETFCHNIGVLSLLERDGIFFYGKGVEVQIGERRKAAAAATPPAAKPLSSPRPPIAAAPRVVRSLEEPHRLFDEALRLAEAKQYEAALERLERLASLKPEFSEAALLKTKILVNCRRFEEAQAACRQALAFERWSLEGRLFLGLIAKIQGDLAAAKQQFKEALYIQPASWVAHFSLADIYRCEGDLAHAAREYRLVIGLLEQQGNAVHGLEYFTFSFSSRQIAHLCRHNLDVMNSPEH